MGTTLVGDAMKKLGRLADKSFVGAVQRLAADEMHTVVAEARSFAVGRT
jgi:hypothetical protein